MKRAIEKLPPVDPLTGATMDDDKRQLPLFGESSGLSASGRPPSSSADVTAFGVSAGWAGLAERAVLQVAQRRRYFTADEIWDTELKPPADSRALGSVLKRAVECHIIERTGRFRTTKRKSRHGAPVAVWRSLLKTMGSRSP
ncbi:MAG: hypothetical protein JRD89_02995 [Deltaproteobacteria bacterium]|nr:hypothetical protein [Deltaproteobacteria bacterium]